jgi:hypothetical protein
MTLPANLILEKNDPNSQSAWVLLLDAWLADGTLLQYARAHNDQVFGRPYYANSNCTGHWKLNDNLPTTTVVDSSGSGNNGTLNGGDNTEDKSTTGRINSAFDFNGIDDEVVVPNFSIVNSDTDRSISLWVKAASGQPLENPGWYRATTNLYMYSIDYGNSGSDTNFVIYDGGNAGVVKIANDDLYDDQWHHVVITVDRANDIMKAYLDGELVDTTDISGVGDTSSPSGSFYIGSRGGTWFFDGLVDNVMTFDKVVSSDEVDVLYNSGTGTELVPNTYTAIGVELDSVRVNNNAELPSLNLTVHDVGLVLRPYLRTLNGAVGSTIRLIVANTAHRSEILNELELEFEVLSTSSKANSVTFKLGVPNVLLQRFPLERDFALYCQFRMRNSDGSVTPECGYTDKTVTGCTLSGSNPVQITATSHGFATGDNIKIADVGGITPSLDGDYDVTYVDANNFTLDGTDSSDYTGPYTSGGAAGYSECPRSLTACRDRENSARFGGAPGLQKGGIRIA